MQVGHPESGPVKPYFTWLDNQEENAICCDIVDNTTKESWPEEPVRGDPCSVMRKVADESKRETCMYERCGYSRAFKVYTRDGPRAHRIAKWRCQHGELPFGPCPRELSHEFWRNNAMMVPLVSPLDGDLIVDDEVLDNVHHLTKLGWTKEKIRTMIYEYEHNPRVYWTNPREREAGTNKVQFDKDPLAGDKNAVGAEPPKTKEKVINLSASTRVHGPDEPAGLRAPAEPKIVAEVTVPRL